MKKNKFSLLFLLIFLLSCSSPLHWKLKIEMPRKTAIDLARFQEIIITNFWVKKQTKDINLSQELIDYFYFTLDKNFKGKIVSKKISFNQEDIFLNQNFWKSPDHSSPKALYLTGTASYGQEIRKAILEERRSDRFESPFQTEKKLVERKFYTLNLDLYLIDSTTGTIIYKRSFKESKGYRNPNQTAYFAFFDLIQRVKDKLSRNIFGGEKIEERYLISD